MMGKKDARMGERERPDDGRKRDREDARTTHHLGRRRKKGTMQKDARRETAWPPEFQEAY